MDFSLSKWIWAEDNTLQNDRVLLRRNFSLEKTPKSAPVAFCVRDAASFFVNGKPVALGIRGYGLYDIAKFLQKGENVLGFDCLYYGTPAGDYTPPPASGIVVSCEELNLFSDESFVAYRPYTQDDGDPRPSGRYFGFNSYTDAGRGELGSVFAVEYGSTLFSPAHTYGAAGNIAEVSAPHRVYDGTVKVKKMEKTADGATVTYVCDLGGEYTFYPVIELTAAGTERVEVKTNAFVTPDAWGSDRAVTGTRGVYICRNGAQQYACPIPLYGSALVITAPATVNIRTVDLRTTRYPVRRVLDIDGDKRMECLLGKCDNTMQACMDDGVLNNTDRDRGCDLFALSIFARSAVLTYNEEVLSLLLSALLDVAKRNEWKNFAGSPFAVENPTANLLFCSRLGAPAAYYYRTGDAMPVKELFPAMCDYLLSYEVNGGRVASRRGDVPYADAGYNTDEELITTCLYYSAAMFLSETRVAAETFTFPNEITARAAAIEDGFAANYYKNGCFSSGSVCDERANALAVLTGLAGERAVLVKDALCSCANSSPAYEGFVIEALGAIGQNELALKRMTCRYLPWIEDEERTTLPEYFFRKGSACSSLSCAPVSAFASGVMGVRFAGVRKMEVTLPHGAEGLRAQFAGCDGPLRIAVKNGTVTVDNDTGTEIAVHDGSRTTVVRKGKMKF